MSDGSVPIALTAADGRVISAHLFCPSTPRPIAILIAGATGVRQGFYSRAAAWLAGQGATVLTLDYRGVGESRQTGTLRHDRALMSDWGRYDIEAALAFLKSAAPGQPLAVIGHSAGGWLLSYAKSGRDVTAVLSVASTNAYWGKWDGVLRWIRWAQWHLLIPAVSIITGRLPRILLGGGDPLPGRLARQWARWGRTSTFLVGDRRDPPVSPRDRFGGSLLAVRIPGDTIAPLAGVQWLPSLYPEASSAVVELDEKYRRVGHFGAFRPDAKELWQVGWEWLNRAARQQQQQRSQWNVSGEGSTAQIDVACC